MRKLKLHVGMSIDGCIAGPNNEMDWMISYPKDRVNSFKFLFHLKPYTTDVSVK
ncbi:hypothetical protein YTPLAS21_20100 [Candidatus Nitrosocosmicus sp.]|nr:hypothetical protein YTPLAS21_20100 [Candidatus Nitrosocosmicus sp.]